MLKNTLYLLLACCLLVSCDDYEWDTKMILEGRVVDHNGNPISGVTVNTYIYQEGTIFYVSFDNSEIMSYTKTDADGRYVMMFPRPKNGQDTVILINADENRNRINEGLSSTVVYNIKQTNFNDHLVNLGEQIIFPTDNITTLNIETVDDPSLNGVITEIEIDGLLKQKTINYNFEIDNAENQFYFYDDYHVATNQTLAIKYKTRNDGPEGYIYTITEVSIPVGDAPVTYTINY